MSDDIVRELRGAVFSTRDRILHDRAADEIERLRTEIDRLRYLDMIADGGVV